MQYELHWTLFPEVAFFMVFYDSDRRRNESTAHEDSWEAATTQNPTNLCSVYPETLQPNLCSWKSWSDVTGKKFCLAFWNIHSQPPMWIYNLVVHIFMSLLMKGKWNNVNSGSEVWGPGKPRGFICISQEVQGRYWAEVITSTLTVGLESMWPNMIFVSWGHTDCSLVESSPMEKSKALSVEN